MRSAEVMRQWKILRTLDTQRLGKTVDALALQLNVHKRTIWRDMEALQEVGFPLTSEPDGRHAAERSRPFAACQSWACR